MSKIRLKNTNVGLDYPTCRPSLNLDFTQEELDPRITFTRASKGTRVNKNRQIELVSDNQPRFDYHPITGESLGLLVEQQSTNLCLFSDRTDIQWLVDVSGGSGTFIDGEIVTSSILSFSGKYVASLSTSSQFVFNNSNTNDGGQPYGVLTGTQSGATRNITNRTKVGDTLNGPTSLSTDVPAPDGSYNAVLHSLSSGSRFRLVQKNSTATTGGTYTFSIFFKNKSITTDYVAISCGDGGSGATANFNFKTKEFGVIITGGGWTGFTGYQDYPNGWIRIWMTATSSGTLSSGASGSLWIGGFTGSYASLGECYTWGGQLEYSIIPTSFIYTTSSQYTRNPELTSMEGANFSSWFNTKEGTFIVNNICRVTGSTNYVEQNNSMFSVSNPDKSSQMNAWYNYYGAALVEVDIYSTSAFIPVSNVPAGRSYIPIRQSVSYKNLDFSVVTNGTICTNDLWPQVPDLLPTDFTRLLIGYGELYTGTLNGTISRLTYYPKKLRTNQLILLTS